MVEKQPYRVERSLGDSVEIRHYPAHRVISVDVHGGIEEAGTLGFRPLVGYISGANASGQKIAMTAPVLQEEADDHYRVSFVLPTDWWDREAPAPVGDRVRVEDRPAAVPRNRWQRRVRRSEVVPATHRSSMSRTAILPTWTAILATLLARST